jgi:hypothetical protein
MVIGGHIMISTALVHWSSQEAIDDYVAHGRFGFAKTPTLSSTLTTSVLS